MNDSPCAGLGHLCLTNFSVTPTTRLGTRSTMSYAAPLASLTPTSMLSATGWPAMSPSFMARTMSSSPWSAATTRRGESHGPPSRWLRTRTTSALWSGGRRPSLGSSKTSGGDPAAEIDRSHFHRYVQRAPKENLLGRWTLERRHSISIDLRKCYTTKMSSPSILCPLWSCEAFTVRAATR